MSNQIKVSDLPNVANFLIENKADIYVDRTQALEIAAIQGNLEVFKMIYKRIPYVSVTVLKYIMEGAKEEGQQHIVDYIKQHIVDYINTITEDKSCNKICDCVNPQFGFDCVCEHAEKNKGEIEFTCEFCGIYNASKPRCNKCEKD